MLGVAWGVAVVSRCEWLSKGALATQKPSVSGTEGHPPRVSDRLFSLRVGRLRAHGGPRKKKERVRGTPEPLQKSNSKLEGKAPLKLNWYPYAVARPEVESTAFDVTKRHGVGRNVPGRGGDR